MKPEDLDDAVEQIYDAVYHAASIKLEARGTPDDEDENGEPINPIHAYAEHCIKDAMPLAIVGVFLILYRRERKAS